MKTTKMSLASIQGKLSRTEMKNIMAGSGGDGTCGAGCNLSCVLTCNGSTVNGTCSTSPAGKCYCSAGC